MAGFRNVVLPLGIYSGAVVPASGGFATPIPGLRLGGLADTSPAGGFGTPIGALLIRTAGRYIAGFQGIIPVVPLGAETPVGGDTEGRRRRTYFTMIGRTRLGR